MTNSEKIQFQLENKIFDEHIRAWKRLSSSIRDCIRFSNSDKIKELSFQLDNNTDTFLNNDLRKKI